MNWIDARARKPAKDKDEEEILIACDDGYCTVTFYCSVFDNQKWTHCGSEVRYWMPLYEELCELEGVVPGKWRHEEEEEENEQRI